MQGSGQEEGRYSKGCYIVTLQPDKPTDGWCSWWPNLRKTGMYIKLAVVVVVEEVVVGAC